MILNDFACFAIIAAVGAVCICAGVVHSQYRDMEMAKAAAAAGLVQQVVVTDGHGTYVLWVKPGEPVKVER